MKRGCKVCLGITGIICLAIVVAAIVIGVFYTPKIPTIDQTSYSVDNFDVCFAFILAVTIIG